MARKRARDLSSAGSQCNGKDPSCRTQRKLEELASSLKRTLLKPGVDLSSSDSSSKLDIEESIEAEKDPFSSNQNSESHNIAELPLESEGVFLDGALTEKVEKDKNSKNDSNKPESEGKFLGKSFPANIARLQWPNRYRMNHKKGSRSKSPKLSDDDDDENLQALHHYKEAEVDGNIYLINDTAYVKAEDGNDHHICKIIEFFEAVDGKLYFTAQWFYRARDTVIKHHGHLIDEKRVFLSEVKDDNPIDCLVAKLKIARMPLDNDFSSKVANAVDYDFYYDMKYFLPYTSFTKLPDDDVKNIDENHMLEHIDETPQMRLLDLYSGCGGMSSGLCLGAKMSGLNLITKWAVDLNPHACESIKLNHPETEVRNEPADDVLMLSKEWEKLCAACSLINHTNSENPYVNLLQGHDDTSEDEEDGLEKDEDELENDPEIFEVQKILDICYGDPKKIKERELYLKVRWKGYGPSEDSWEPIRCLGECKQSIKEFVISGYKLKIIPLPGEVDVICGGPPCQGISGFNRFRNNINPLEDEKNKQLLVFMNFVEYLKPKFVLMENVVDILKFSEGYLGRYAIGQLVRMNYQARIGIMAAGAYGLPQFRLRVFLWGASPSEILPPYPLPTHDAVLRGIVPLEFQINIVGHDEGHTIPLKERLLLEDAISDLPLVPNDEVREEMPYEKAPLTSFQNFIRSRKDATRTKCDALYDHQPLKLNDDDFQRVCEIPKKKGANFRDLPGVIVGDDKKVKWDPNVERIYLPSGKPLVPDYAMSFIEGRSSKPFGRLWWDETVPTVVTRAEPHNQIILHPDQDRVLSIRENARLQGFPDYYKFCGPIKERYIQVGNAVAVPVARALGYALGKSWQKSIDNSPLFALPSNFSEI